MSQKLKLDQLKIASFVTRDGGQEAIIGGVRLTRKVETSCTDTVHPGCFSAFC